MGVHPSQISKQEPEHKLDYTLPIAREGEEQFGCILRNRSGMDAGNIDFGLRDCTHLHPSEQQDIVDMCYAMYESACSQLGLTATKL